MKIFLDDIRDPYDETWTLVRSFDDFMKIVLSGKPITHLSFDHDLGLIGRMEAPSGMDAAKFFVDEALDDPSLVKNLQSVHVHSSNPAGVQNIVGLFKSARKQGVFDESLNITP